jgi:hypothetical protein
MKSIRKALVSALTILLLWSCTSKQEKMENRLKAFISVYETKVIPLYRETSLASWNANISGTKEDWAKSEKASFEYAKIFTDIRMIRALPESSSKIEPSRNL